ncbi:MAG: competence protein ComJ [Caulobacteraceae bacterium]
MKIQLSLSHNQLCVFDPSLDAPFNDWTDAHFAQGFSWRPGSVSFAVDDDHASAIVDVTCSESPPDLAGAESAIRVPFHVAESGQVEVGSILGGAEASLPPGSYALHFLAPQKPDMPFKLVFVPSSEVEPLVLRGGSRAQVQDRYLMIATPA